MTEPTSNPQEPTADQMASNPTTVDHTSHSQTTNSTARVTFNYLVIAIAFFVLGLFIGATSFGKINSIFTSNVEQVVRSLLEEAAILKPLQDMDRLVDDDPYIGELDAPIVIVEFSAYACPYCGRFHNDTLPSILENYGEYIRYVYRDFPSINPEVSYAAALAAGCALDQDSYWDYQAVLFQNQNLLGSAYLMEAAEELGLEMQTFRECYESQDHLPEIEADFQDGVTIGIQGTPSFYINGKFHSGARPFSYFETVILDELERLGVAVES